MSELQALLRDHENYPRSICRHPNPDEETGEWISVLSEGSCSAWHGVDCVVRERGEGDLGRLRRIGALGGAWGDSFSEKPLLQRAAVSLRQSCVSSPCEKMAAVDRHAIRK